MPLVFTAVGDGIDFASNALGGFLTSVRESLVGEYVFGGTLANSVKNLANPAKPLIGHGDMAVAANYVETKGGSLAGGDGIGFDTGLFETPEITLVSCCWSSEQNFSQAIGNFTGDPNGRAFGMYMHPGYGKFYLQTHIVPPAAALRDLDLAAPFDAFRIFVVRVAAGDGTGFNERIDQFCAGAHTTKYDTIAAVRAVNTDNPLTFGMGFTAPVAQAAGLIYDRFLSDAEVMQVAAEARAALATRGVAT